MKRFIVVSLILLLSLLPGCTLPLIGNISESADSDKGQQMITAPADSRLTGMPDGSASGNGTADQAANGLCSQAGTTGGSISAGHQGVATSAAVLGTAGGALNQGLGDGIASSAAAEASAGSAAAIADTAAAAGGASNATDDTAAAADNASAAVPSGAEAEAVAGSAVADETYRAGQDIPAQTAPEQSAFLRTDSAGTANVTETRYPVTVYYQDGDGCLIPMTRWIQPQQGIARAAVSLCIDSAIAREEVAYYGVYPVIPANTSILGINIREGIAVIDFDRHLLHYADAVSEKNIIASIVYTLTEFKNINGVRILVNGYPQDVLKYGTDISGVLKRDDIAVNSNITEPGSGRGKVDVFFLKKANEGFTYVVPVSVSVNEAGGGPDTNAQEAKLLLRQLFAGNGGKGAFTELPEGVELLGCGTENGTLTVNFSRSFLGYGGNEREESILKQVAYTVRQIDGIKRLKILVEGLPARLPEGTDISPELPIPATINDVMDR